MVLLNHSSFATLKKKFIHSKIAMISCKLNSAKNDSENFNEQISIGVEPGYMAIIESNRDFCISECELPLRFGLLCKYWLYQYVINQISFLISLIHSQLFYKRNPFVVSWKMNFDLKITVDEMLVMTLQNKKTLCEDVNSVIGEDKN